MSLSDFEKGKFEEVKGKKLRAPLPETEYDAVVFGVAELGEHVTYYQDEAKPPKTLIKIFYEIPGVEEDGSSRLMGSPKYPVPKKDFGLEKSNVYKVLSDLLGTKGVEGFKEKLQKDGLQAILGVGVRLTLSSFVTTKGDEIQVVDSVRKLDPRIEVPKGTEEPFIFKITDKDAGEVFKTKLNYYTQQDIITAVNADTYPAGLQQAIAEVLEERNDRPENKVLG